MSQTAAAFADARRAAVAVCRRIGADPDGPIGNRVMQACTRLSAAAVRDIEQAVVAWSGSGVPDGPLQRLFDDATNRETYFFRDRAQLTLLRDLLAESGPVGTLSVWSAGCASGEEPYSVAILLSQMAGLKRLSVLGTDLSAAALAAAAAAAYRTGPMSPCRSLIEADEPYLPLTAGGWRQVGVAIRRQVRFAQHNLVSAPPPGAPFDVILCRNVMIYMEPAARAACMAVLDASLRPGGILLTGPGDTGAQGYRPVVRGRAMAFIKDALINGAVIKDTGNIP